MWLLLPLLGAPSVAAPPAEVAELPSTDEAVIRSLIADQIAAFERRDAPAAWRHVAPGLKERFGTADNFLEMVVVGYPPVATPRGWTFVGDPILLPTGDWGQLLLVEGPDGVRVEALYLLERQPDGTWRTSGCVLLPPGDGRTTV